MSKFEGIFKFQKEEKNAFHSWFGFPLTILNKKIDRDKICKFLNKNGIETRPVVSGNLNKQPAVKHVAKRVYGKLENANYVMENSFSLGCHQDVKNEEIDYVSDLIEDYLRKNL